MVRHINPDITLKAFSCPHCHAIADQTWYELLGYRLTEDDKIPKHVKPDIEEYLENAPELDIPAEAKKTILKWAKRELAGEVFFHGNENPYEPPKLKNIHVSKCYSCKMLAVWVAHKVVWPEVTFFVEPSHNMPNSVRVDFEEAALVFKNSPRSSAALLRLAIEKLCNELNGTEDRVFDGIGKLVKAGLDPKIQKALDVVRVTGNDAVHPGQMNLNDTPEVAERLFKLVNVIVENLITLPNEIDEIYSDISDGKKVAIERRDAT